MSDKDNVETLPRRFQFPRTRFKNLTKYEPPDELIWEICCRIQKSEAPSGKCLHCPDWETHAECGIPTMLLEGEEDKLVRGCRMTAKGVAQVAMLLLEKK